MHSFDPANGLGPVPPAFDASVQRSAFRRFSWVLGGGFAALWFGAMLAFAVSVGRVPFPEVLVWTLFASLLVGRIAASVAHALLRTAWSPARIDVSLSDPEAFRDRVARVRWYGYRLRHRDRAGALFRPRTAKSTLPPLRVVWHRDGAHIEGPRILVRAAARWAVV